MEEYFTIQTPDHHTSLFSELHTLQKQGVLCDVILAAEDGEVMAHKVILMASSPYFQEKLSSSIASSPSRIVLRGISVVELANLVKYIYTGKLLVAKETMDIILELSEILQIQGIILGFKDILAYERLKNDPSGFAAKKKEVKSVSYEHYQTTVDSDCLVNNTQSTVAQVTSDCPGTSKDYSIISTVSPVTLQESPVYTVLTEPVEHVTNIAHQSGTVSQQEVAGPVIAAVHNSSMKVCDQQYMEIVASSDSGNISCIETSSPLEQSAGRLSSEHKDLLEVAIETLKDGHDNFSDGISSTVVTEEISGCLSPKKITPSKSPNTCTVSNTDPGHTSTDENLPSSTTSSTWTENQDNFPLKLKETNTITSNDLPKVTVTRTKSGRQAFKVIRAKGRKVIIRQQERDVKYAKSPYKLLHGTPLVPGSAPPENLSEESDKHKEKSTKDDLDPEIEARSFGQSVNFDSDDDNDGNGSMDECQITVSTEDQPQTRQRGGIQKVPATATPGNRDWSSDTEKTTVPSVLHTSDSHKEAGHSTEKTTVAETAELIVVKPSTATSEPPPHKQQLAKTIGKLAASLELPTSDSTSRRTPEKSQRNTTELVSINSCYSGESTPDKRTIDDRSKDDGPHTDNEERALPESVDLKVRSSASKRKGAKPRRLPLPDEQSDVSRQSTVRTRRNSRNESPAAPSKPAVPVVEVKSRRKSASLSEGTSMETSTEVDGGRITETAPSGTLLKQTETAANCSRPIGKCYVKIKKHSKQEMIQLARDIAAESKCDSPQKCARVPVEIEIDELDREKNTSASKKETLFKTRQKSRQKGKTPDLSGNTEIKDEVESLEEFTVTRSKRRRLQVKEKESPAAKNGKRSAKVQCDKCHVMLTYPDRPTEHSKLCKGVKGRAKISQTASPSVRRQKTQQTDCEAMQMTCEKDGCGEGGGCEVQSQQTQENPNLLKRWEIKIERECDNDGDDDVDSDENPEWKPQSAESTVRSGGRRSLRGKGRRLRGGRKRQTSSEKKTVKMTSVHWCTVCSASFQFKMALQNHMRKNHLEHRQEECEMCPQRFWKKIELHKHMFKVHKVPLPKQYTTYACRFCDFVSWSKNHVDTHMQSHKEERDFSCDECGKTFKSATAVQRHKQRHGEKKFACPHPGCEYKSVSRQSTEIHFRLKHDTSTARIMCVLCSYSSPLKGNVDKHIRTVHGLDVVTKHTLQKREQFNNKETGAIITKDGEIFDPLSKTLPKKERKKYTRKNTGKEMKPNSGENTVSATVKSVKSKDAASHQIKKTVLAKKIADVKDYMSQDIEYASTLPQFPHASPQIRKAEIAQSNLVYSTVTEEEANNRYMMLTSDPVDKVPIMEKEMEVVQEEVVDGTTSSLQPHNQVILVNTGKGDSVLETADLIQSLIREGQSDETSQSLGVLTALLAAGQQMQTQT